LLAIPCTNVFTTPTSNSLSTAMHAAILALAFGRYALAAPLPVTPSPQISLHATPTPLPSYTKQTPTMVMATATPVPSVSGRAIGCTNGLLCPYREHPLDGGLDLPFFICADEDSAECYASRALEVVPASWARTATSGGARPSRIPDFGRWRSEALSSIASVSAVSSASAAASRAQFSATAVAGQSPEKTEEEQAEKHRKEGQSAVNELMNSKYGDEEELEPLLEAAYAVPGADPATTGSTDPLSDANISADSTNDGLLDEQMSIAGMRRGIKVYMPRKLDEDLEELMNSKFGDDWFNTFEVAEPSSDGVPSPVTSATSTLVGSFVSSATSITIDPSPLALTTSVSPDSSVLPTIPTVLISANSTPLAAAVTTSTMESAVMTSKVHVARSTDKEFVTKDFETLMDGQFGAEWFNAFEVAESSFDDVSSALASATPTPLSSSVSSPIRIAVASTPLTSATSVLRDGSVPLTTYTPTTPAVQSLQS
jgi:hypothetical protein